MENEIIVVKQLPVIEEQLMSVRQRITDIVNDALAMECNEETYKEVKKARADLNAQYRELEARRRDVKSRIEAPYKAFEQVYKACAGDIFSDADKKLAAKIRAVEDGIKYNKESVIRAYFNEYAASICVPEELAVFEYVGANITMSATEKSLKENVREYLDGVVTELNLIDDMYPDISADVRAEYMVVRNLAVAVKNVRDRINRLEIEKKRREQYEKEKANAVKKEEEIAAIIESAAVESVEDPEQEFSCPVVTVSADNEKVKEADSRVFSVSFKVTGTIDQLKAMKKFLNDGGYEYEQL